MTTRDPAAIRAEIAAHRADLGLCSCRTGPERYSSHHDECAYCESIRAKIDRLKASMHAEEPTNGN